MAVVGVPGACAWPQMVTAKGPADNTPSAAVLAPPTDEIALGDWPTLLQLLDQWHDTPADARADWLAALQLPAPQRAALHRLLAQRQRLADHSGFLADLPALDLPRQVVAGLQPGAR